MKLTCAYSGLHLTISHFPATVQGRYYYHPIFDVPQKELLQYTRDWASHKMTAHDSYLYYLALLNSTDLIQWRSHAQYGEHTDKIVAANMESLLRCIAKINLVTHPAFVLHRICIHKDTADLSNSSHWIDNWHKSYADFSTGYKDAIQHDKVVARERALERMIKDANKPISSYAKQIAEWARAVGEFPSRVIKVNGKLTTLGDYWVDIIIRCISEDRIFQIPEVHLERLIEYCIENIDAGSIQANTLFKLLRSGHKKQIQYLGDDLESFDSLHPGFKIIPRTTSVEQANLIALIESAPKEKPVRDQYPSDLAYWRAKQKYDLAQKHLADKVIEAKIDESIQESESESESESQSMQDAVVDSLILDADDDVEDEDVPEINNSESLEDEENDLGL